MQTMPTPTLSPSSNGHAMVKDPVCGMEVDPANAAAQRELDGKTFSFCSEGCARRFDRKHTASITTGVGDTGETRWIDLPLVNDLDRRGASPLVEKLEQLPGVRQVVASPGGRQVHVVFHSKETTVASIVAGVRANGNAVGTATTQLSISGLHCASCVSAIEQALQQTRGVLTASVNPATAQARIEYVPVMVELAGLTRAIEDVGYEARPAPAPTETGMDREAGERAREYAALLRKFWFAAIVSIPVILLSYPDYLPGLNTYLTPGSDARRIAWAFLAVLTLPVLFWAGSHYFTGAWQSFKHRQANMYSLIAIGTSAAWIYSTIAVAVPRIFPTVSMTDTFYDVTAVVVALVNLGLEIGRAHV